MKGTRRTARELALQALYALELTDLSLEKVLDDPLIFQKEEANTISFAKDLIGKTFSHSQKIDVLIKGRSNNWEFDRIAIIDRLILRIAICEFLFFEDIPPKVSIDEAIEISKNFSTEQSGRFINGILDSVLKDLRKTNQLVKSGRGLKEGLRTVKR